MNVCIMESLVVSVQPFIVIVVDLCSRATVIFTFFIRYLSYQKKSDRNTTLPLPIFERHLSLVMVQHFLA